MANFRVDMNKQTQYDELASNTDKQYGLPEGMTKLVMMIENRNNPANRTSPKGASGVMQIMPANFKALGVTDPSDPQQSFMAAGKLLADSMKRYGGNVGAALADYNGGPKVASQYLAGKALNPETAAYIEYAKPYMDFDKPSKYGQATIGAAADQASQFSPSDLNEGVSFEQDTEEFVTGMGAELDAQLAQEAKFYDLSTKDAISTGFRDTLTSAVSHAMEREDDDSFVMGDEQYETLKQRFPQGLGQDAEARIRNSRSQSDFEFNMNRVQEQNEFGQKLSNQTGWSKAGAYAGVLGGALFDPVALPAGTLGASGRLIKGSSALAGAGRMALEGAAGSAMVSPAIQQIDKGYVSGGEVLQHMGTGAVFGAGLGLAGKVAGWGGKKLFEGEVEAAQIGRVDGNPTYHANEVPTGDDGLAVNFRDAKDTGVGEAGEIVGVGATAVRKAADNWDESVSPAVEAVQKRRQAYYGSNLRQKVTGWADSENVQLARSKSKVARFVGAQWGGDATGLGKQSARPAAVIKEQLKDGLDFEFIPAMKEYFEMGLTSAEKIDYMAGGADGARKAFSKEVQMERYKLRQYKAANEGKAEGYVSEAPRHIKQAADKLDELYGVTKKMHIENETEHASILKDSDNVGYIEQKPDFIEINKASPEKKKAFLDMVKDDYRAEVTAKISNLRKDSAEWMEKAYARAETDMEAPWVSEFLENPEKYFDTHVEKLSKKLHTEMEKRASHWWENALRDPEARYQNSEASLLTLAKELADERLGGQTVDSEMLQGFKDALTTKWADTSRRELNMLNSRDTAEGKVHLLDMFNHDVFSATKRTINDTSGRVAMAKLGWKTQQDIDDTLIAMAHSGATPREVQAAKHVSDIILGRAKGLDDNPLVKAMSNLTHSAMMGKLGMSVLADLPTAIGNLGVGGIFKALGEGFGKKVIDGSMFVRNGRLTKVGSDLDASLKGLMGHDNEMWIPQAVNADGFAMEAGGSMLRRTEAAARFTNTMSGANALTKMVGTGVTKASTQKLHKAFRTGKGISEARFADIGIHGPEFKRIKAQFDKYSSKEDFGLDKWDDPLAKEMLITSAHRYSTQSTMNKSYAGDLPQWTRDTVLGYLYSRFRSIGIKAQEKVLVRNMTLADSNTVAMMVGGVAFATFLAYARIHIDAATNKDGRKVLKERLTPLGITDQVGRFASVMGLTSEMTSLMQLMTTGTVQGSDTPLTGAVSNITGAVGKTGQAITGNGEWNAAGKAGMKLLPGANTYQMLLLQKAIDD